MVLKDKVVVITGSSSGIGKATAELFAQEGAKLVLNSRRNEAGGQQVAAELSKSTAAIYVQADVGSAAGARKLLDAAVEEFGQIDVLINNAGLGAEPDFLKLTEDDVINVLHDNLFTTLYCSQYAINLAVERDAELRIINTSSIRGWEFGARSPIYGLAKAGVNSLTRTLAKNYSPKILVNAVGPGFVRTPNYDSVDPAKLKSYIDQTTLKRWMQPEEVAGAYVFIAKNDAMTGEIVYVDAGFRLKF